MNLKPFYTISELAKLCDVAPRTIKRMFKKKSVPLTIYGSKSCVLLKDLYALDPDLFDSIELASKINQAE